jgi:hypothetical protein
MKFFGFLGAVIIFGLFFTSLAWSASCGETLIENAVLTTDLVCSGNGLELGANGISLNCQGHSISKTGSGGTGVLVNNTLGVTISNCSILDFDYGVFVENSNHSIYANNTINSTVSDLKIVSTSYNNTFINNSFLTGIEDVSSGFDRMLFSNNYGLMEWNLINISIGGGLSLGQNVYLEENLLGLANEIDLKNYNSSAQLTFFNLSSTLQPFLLKNGIRCDDGSNCNVSLWNSTSGEFKVNVSGFSNYSSQVRNADLFVNSANITVSPSNPVENQTIVWFANIYNLGLANATEVLVQFFDSGTQIANTTTNITSGLNLTVNVSYVAKVALNPIFVQVDGQNLIYEDSESNNNASSLFEVGSYHTFYGSVNVTLLVGSINNSLITFEDAPIRNIYVTHLGSVLNFDALKPIGKNTTQGNSSSDFSEIDSLLNTSAHLDSIVTDFGNGNPGIAAHEKLFNVEENSMSVPYINSSADGNFTTGLLWDSSDDSNGEYDSIEAEDLVFVSEYNRTGRGTVYGEHNYVIKVPALLRNYKETNSLVYFYFDII